MDRKVCPCIWYQHKEYGGLQISNPIPSPNHSQNDDAVWRWCKQTFYLSFGKELYLRWNANLDCAPVTAHCLMTWTKRLVELLANENWKLLRHILLVWSCLTSEYQRCISQIISQTCSCDSWRKNNCKTHQSSCCNVGFGFHEQWQFYFE